jgi:hypothetical protein
MPASCGASGGRTRRRQTITRRGPTGTIAVAEIAPTDVVVVPRSSIMQPIMQHGGISTVFGCGPEVKSGNKGVVPMRSRRSLRLLPLLAVVLGSFGMGILISSRLQGRAAIAAVPRSPWVRADGTIDQSAVPACVGVSGPDGQSIRGRDGKPICVPWGSWESKDGFRQVTADQVARLSASDRQKVHKFEDGSLWFIEQPKGIDYRYFIEKYGLPNPYGNVRHSDPVKGHSTDPDSAETLDPPPNR